MARLSESSLISFEQTPSRRFFEEGTALNRVWCEAPYLPRCSTDKTAARVRPREYAIRYPYMQINRSGFVSWLIFDLDHADAMIWETQGLPAPNMMVRNRANGHTHLYYAITPVCTSERARSKPIAFMKAVYSAFAIKLNADLNFHSGPVAKTPGHPWWLTHELHGAVYELGALADYVDLDSPNRFIKQPRLEAFVHSRHCTLFEELRYYAYSIVNRERESGSFERFTRLLDAYAFNKNNFLKQGFDQNLPLSSLRSTVKSVSRWTWDRYSGQGRCNKGVMQLDAGMPLSEKQRLAAARTHKARCEATTRKISAACRHLKAAGHSITQQAVSKLSGLTRQTVAKYRDILSEIALSPLQNVVSAIKRVAVNDQRDVKFGDHQVTALVFGALDLLQDGMLDCSIQSPLDG